MTTSEGSFNKALKHTLAIEGGYSDDPDDSGGKTNWGITEGLAREWGYTGDMKDLTKQDAINIYRKAFWNHSHLQCGEIAAYSEPLALELFDTAVNMGVFAAAAFLQIAMNALNYNYRDEGIFFPDIKVDGWIGQLSLKSLKCFQRPVDKDVLRKMCDCLQGVRYLGIMLPEEMLDTVLDNLRGDYTQKKYARGWFDKRIGEIHT